MFSLETLIMISSIAFCIGGLVGAVISRTLLPPENQKGLETKLQESREELERYQQEVTKHFAETSKLVNNLTQSYKEVHEHLTKGAIQLSNAEIGQQILQSGDPSLGIEAKDAIENVNFEPPKDYAPKTPGQVGTLSEEFGLNEDEEESSIETITATGAPRAVDKKENSAA